MAPTSEFDATVGPPVSRRSCGVAAVVGLLSYYDDQSLVIVTEATHRHAVCDRGPMPVQAIAKTSFLPLKPPPGTGTWSGGPVSQQPSQPSTAPEARLLAHGCPLGPRGEPLPHEGRGVAAAAALAPAHSRRCRRLCSLLSPGAEGWAVPSFSAGLEEPRRGGASGGSEARQLSRTRVPSRSRAGRRLLPVTTGSARVRRARHTPTRPHAHLPTRLCRRAGPRGQRRIQMP